MDSFRVAVIGLGSIGLRMLEAFTGHQRFEVAAVWDPSDAACARARERYPELTFAADADSLHNTDGVDVVYLACPPATHREHALRAINAGRAVHCEKPLGVDLKESQSLVETVEAKGANNSVNLLYSAARASATLQSAFDNVELGEVSWVDIHLHLPQWAEKRYAEAPWLANRAQGGFVREVTTHYLFLCQRLFGELELTSCTVDYPDDGVSAVSFADVLMTAGDTRITLTGSTLGAGPDVVHANFWGSAAALRLRDLHYLDRYNGSDWVLAVTHEHRPELDTYFRLLDNLADKLAGKPHRLPDFREAFETQKLVEAILAS